MILKCSSCGKFYDFEKHETCPKCGAYNQPPASQRPAAGDSAVRDSTGPGFQRCPNCGRLYDPGREGACPRCSAGHPPEGTAGAAGSTSARRPDGAAYEQNRAVEKRNRRMRLLRYAILLLVFLVLMRETFGGVERPEDTAASPPRSEAPAAIPESTQEIPGDAAVNAQASPLEEPKAVLEEPEAVLEEPAPTPDPEQPSAPSEVQPGGDILHLASRVYGQELGIANGVRLTINAAGPVDLPAVRELLMPGEKAIFIDFTAQVEDSELFEKVFFQPPYVTVKQESGRSLNVYGMELGSPFVVLDVDGMRYTDRTAASGQLFFAIPEDCYSFMVRYSDQQNYAAQSIQV